MELWKKFTRSAALMGIPAALLTLFVPDAASGKQKEEPRPDVTAQQPNRLPYQRSRFEIAAERQAGVEKSTFNPYKPNTLHKSHSPRSYPERAAVPTSSSAAPPARTGRFGNPLEDQYAAARQGVRGILTYCENKKLNDDPDSSGWSAAHYAALASPAAALCAQENGANIDNDVLAPGDKTPWNNLFCHGTRELLSVYCAIYNDKQPVPNNKNDKKPVPNNKKEPTSGPILSKINKVLTGNCFSKSGNDLRNLRAIHIAVMLGPAALKNFLAKSQNPTKELNCELYVVERSQDPKHPQRRVVTLEELVQPIHGPEGVKAVEDIRKKYEASEANKLRAMAQNTGNGINRSAVIGEVFRAGDDLSKAMVGSATKTATPKASALISALVAAKLFRKGASGNSHHQVSCDDPIKDNARRHHEKAKLTLRKLGSPSFS